MDEYGSQLEDLARFAQEIGFSTSRAASGSHLIIRGDNLRVSLNVEVGCEGKVLAYLYARTLSWDLPGERTDANELLSVLVAAFLRIEGFASCCIWDVPHPVAAVTWYSQNVDDPTKSFLACWQAYMLKAYCSLSLGTIFYII